jgi:3-hydroxybutyryl-CoA dehydratase
MLNNHKYADIVVGQREKRLYIIEKDVYQKFLETFQDFSPIHINAKYAESQGFAGVVMHGTILNGFISHFVGMHFPGRFSLLLSVDMRYLKPSYLGDSIWINSVVSQKMDASKVLVLDLELNNCSQNALAARARVQVMVKENGEMVTPQS